MNPTTPHDPLDDLIAAALHGELTPGERAQFDSRLQNDPAAQAAYQEAKLMHDLLEKTHQDAQPDSSFEQRMVSGVRRKIKQDEHRETAWESLLVLWTSVKRFMPRRYVTQYGIALAFVSLIGISAFIYTGNQVKGVFTTISSQLAYAGSAGDDRVGKLQTYAGKTIFMPMPDATRAGASPNDLAALDQAKADKDAAASESRATRDLKKVIEKQGINYVETAQKGITLSGYANTNYTQQFAGADQTRTVMDKFTPPHAPANVNATPMEKPQTWETQGQMGALASSPDATTPQGGTVRGKGFSPSSTDALINSTSSNISTPADALAATPATPKPPVLESGVSIPRAQPVTSGDDLQLANGSLIAANAASPSQAPTTTAPGSTPAPAAPPVVDTRKLIRNAQLDLEVKSFQAAVDQVTDLAKAGGGYIDSSNSQKGGNGKLQGTVVVKILPQYLDSFLLKLRDLGELRNQSVSTDDVTKDYFDTQARLANSQKMEAQLQDLLKRENGKVSDLLQVERELARVRGNIEEMQGQLKLYDFQVQFATITINMREKDLNQAAAYLLKEQDQFALFANNVEQSFQDARKAADDFKAQILSATLNHESGSNVSADLTIMVAPDQIEAFLNRIRGLGRVANFTRQTERVAKDGGDSDQPADQTLTEKDKVQVQISIRSDDESRKQVTMTIVAPKVDEALDQAKTAALTGANAEILNSSLNKTQDGGSNGQLTVRVPGKNYQQLLDAYRALGRAAAFNLQRDDNSGPGANGDDAPVIVSLSLTDIDQPVQATDLSIVAENVNDQAQQLKKSAADSGVTISASNFQRTPDGMEIAQMTFRLPMGKYAAFLDSLKKLGHVESLTVNRVDRPDQTRSDDTAPVEISLRMHNHGDIVANDEGFWATMRETFGQGAMALFGSIRVIGVLVAYFIPWALAIGLVAWVARRIYVWKKK
jgi:hypothetical protein